MSKKILIVTLLGVILLASSGVAIYLVNKSDGSVGGSNSIGEDDRRGDGSNVVDGEEGNRDGIDSDYENALGNIEYEDGVMEIGETIDIEDSDSGTKMGNVDEEKEVVDKEENEEGNTYVVSRSRNTSIAKSNRESDKDSEFEYSEEEEVRNGSGSVAPRSQLKDVGSKKNSSNDVSVTEDNHNKYSEAVKDIYEEELGLQVVPDNGGYFVFDGDFSHTFNSNNKKMYFTSDPKYDDVTVKVISKLGIGLNESQVMKGINDSRLNKDKETIVNGVVFIHTGNLDEVRW